MKVSFVCEIVNTDFTVFKKQNDRGFLMKMITSQYYLDMLFVLKVK